MSDSTGKHRQRVIIPCETLTARVLLGPSEVPTPLEELVLTALHRGARTVRELIVVFGIGHRPMLRLILDLLNRALVTFNFSTGEIRLNPRVSELVEANRLAEIGPSERTESRYVLMRDLFAGTILPLRRRGSIGTALRLPPLLEPNSKTKVGADAVVRAIRAQLLGRTTRAGRPLHVLDVSFEVPGTVEADDAGAIRELEIEIAYYIDPASDYLRIIVEYPDDLPWRTRTEIEKKLTQLANDDEPLHAFKNLRAKAAPSGEPTVVRGLHPHIQYLQSLVARLDRAEDGTYMHWQQNLERAAVPLRAALDLYGGRLETELITGSDRHITVINEMIRSARRQLILTCPFVHYDATWQYREAIEQALGGGRTIFLLFGIGDELELEPGVANWLYDLKAKYNNRIFFSDRSARCHAKFVVVDANDVLLTSYNFFGSLPGSVFELGLRLTAGGPSNDGSRSPQQSVCRPALELLALSKEIFPDYADGQLISDSGIQFGISDGEQSHVAEFPYFADAEQQLFMAQREALWKRDWHRYVDRMDAYTAQLGTTYQLIRNAEHRQLLFEALRTAQRRLLVLSDQLSSRMIDRRFIQELERCLGRGVHIMLVYRRPEQTAQDTLMRLALTHSEHLRLLRVGGVSSASCDINLESHAKLIVCDDWAVVSSFNFLSFSGDYEGAERYRIRTEAGIWMHGSGTVEQLLTRVTASIPSVGALSERDSITAVEPAGAVSRQTEQRPTIRNVGLLIDELSAELSEGGPKLSASDERRRLGRPISAWFGAAPSPEVAFAELAELEAIKAPFLDQAMAACLYLHPNAASILRHTWLEKLIYELWWRANRDPHAVALLLQMVSSTSSRAVPPLALAMLDAHCKDGRATQQTFEDAALDCSDPRLALAITALAIPRVLFHIAPPSQALQLLLEEFGQVLGRWPARALEFRSNFPAGLAGIELDTVIKSDNMRRRAEQARAELVEELRRCVGLRSLDFKLGQRTWALVVTRLCGLADLLEAAESGRDDRIRHCLTHHYALPPYRLLDNAMEEAAESMNLRTRPQITGARRRMCLDHLGKVLRLARAWIDATSWLGRSADLLPADQISDFAKLMAEDAGFISTLTEQLRYQQDYAYPLIVELQRTLEQLLQLA